VRPGLFSCTRAPSDLSLEPDERRRQIGLKVSIDTFENVMLPVIRRYGKARAVGYHHERSIAHSANPAMLRDLSRQM
jgi:hypothetical protein